MQDSKEKFDWKKLISNRAVFLIFLNILIIIFMAFLSPYFLRLDNLLNMTKYGAVLLLIAMGQTVVILGGGGGIDLSLGSLISLSGIILGILVTNGVNVWVACFLTFVFGVLIGLLQGFLIAYLKMPAFAVTLGGLYTYGALALVITNGIPVSGFPTEFGFLGQGTFLGLPAQVMLVVIPVFIILYWVLNKTTFGRSIYLIGVNDKAANLSGINVEKTRMLLYGISGGTAALAAIINTAWFMTARPDAGYGLELQAITVAVLGGIHIFGGVGSLAGTLLAGLTITIIGYGMQIANINTIWQLAVLGFLLLGAVILNKLASKR